MPGPNQYVLDVDPAKSIEAKIARDIPFYESVINLEVPEAFEIIGNVGTGKSALVALMAEYFYKNNHLIYDLLASDSDHENLNWLVPGRGKLRYPILLVHSRYTDVYIPPHLEGVVIETTDEHDLYDLAKQCIEEKRVLVFDNASYEPAHYRAILLKWFSEIIPTHRRLFKEYRMRGCVLLREMYKLLPSQGGTKVGKDGMLLKEIVKTMFRERRRGPLFFIGDIQRDIELDKGIRSLMTTRIVRRSPERALESDVMEIDRIVQDYYDQVERQGGFLPAAHKTWPKINSLTNTQLYAIKHNGQILYRSSIPLPGHGYIDAFREDVEERLGLRITMDLNMQKEFFNAKGKRIDHNFWIERIGLQYVMGNSPLTAVRLMELVEWQQHTGEGLPEFLKLLDLLQKGGMLTKYSNAREGIPVSYRLSEAVAGVSNEGDGVSQPRATIRMPKRLKQKIKLTRIHKAILTAIYENVTAEKPQPKLGVRAITDIVKVRYGVSTNRQSVLRFRTQMIEAGLLLDENNLDFELCTKHKALLAKVVSGIGKKKEEKKPEIEDAEDVIESVTDEEG